MHVIAARIEVDVATLANMLTKRIKIIAACNFQNETFCIGSLLYENLVQKYQNAVSIGSAWNWANAVADSLYFYTDDELLLLPRGFS